MLSTLFFYFNFKSSTLLFFFLLEILFAIICLFQSSRSQNYSGHWLSAFLFLSALYIGTHMFGYAGWYSNRTTREILFFLPLMHLFLIGPVVYFYVSRLLNYELPLRGKNLWHFFPACVYILYSLVIFVIDKLILDEFYFYADGRDKDLANWYQIAGFFSMLIYLSLSLSRYLQYKRIIFNTVSYAEAIVFKWVRNFIIAFLLILCSRLIFFIIHPEWGQFGSQFWYYSAFSLIVAYVAIAGYSHLVKFNTLTESYALNHYEFSVPSDQGTASEHLSNSIKTEVNVKSAFTDQELEEWKEKISRRMLEKKLFQNPKLSLTDLAEELETNTRVISTAINQGFNMNFNDYVNNFRIEAVKQALKEDLHQDKSLLGIALDSGFNSKATFNRAFKKITQQTPKEYLEQN